MTVQIVDIGGQKMAVLPVADYERLLELTEDRADIAAASDAERRRAAGEEYLPVAMLDQIIAGESALRIWRKYRGMTLQHMGAKVGSAQSFLSEIENRKRRGSPALWRKLADALNVRIEDILPED